MWRSSVSHFSGDAEGSSLPEGRRPISFSLAKSPVKLSAEIRRLAGHNPSPDVAKRPGGGKK